MRALVILTCCQHNAAKTSKQEATDGISAIQAVADSCVQDSVWISLYIHVPGAERREEEEEEGVSLEILCGLVNTRTLRGAHSF